MKIDYSCVENGSNTLHNPEKMIQEIQLKSILKNLATYFDYSNNKLKDFC